MALDVRWTIEAEQSFEKIVKYIDEEWTFREVQSYVIKVNQLIESIRLYPYQYRKLSKYNIRIAVIGKHNSLIYRVNESDEIIELLVFWNHRNNPKRMKY